MSYATIRARRQGPVGVLTLNRPEVLNAFNSQLMHDVTEAMRDFVEDPAVNAIVIHGDGRAFSAGFDMKESASRSVSGTDEWRRLLQDDLDFIMQFWDCEKPTIAAIHGHCLAGAFELALACDLTVAAEGTMLGEPEVRFGSAMVCLLLPLMTTPKLAKEMLLTGNDRIDAQRAAEMGIVNHVVQPGTELDFAIGLANDVATAAPFSVRLTKRAINRAYSMMGLRETLLAGIDTATMVESEAGPERVEFNRLRREKGLKAALEWRDARFRAR